MSFVVALLALLMIEPVAAQCREPVMAVQVEHRKELEGEVEAGVAMFRGGASGSAETQASWQANLPSQSMVDNQWRLYLLCQEYEAGRLSRDAYCAASSGIWEAIVGQPIPVEGCTEDAEPPPSPAESVVGQAPSPPMSAASAPVVPASPPEQEPELEPAPEARVAAPAPSAEPSSDVSSEVWAPDEFAARSSRWSLPPDADYELDLWGPLRLQNGDDVWVVFNGACLSFLGMEDGRMVESMLLDRRECSPWSTIAISQEAGEVRLVADGSEYLFSRQSGPPSGPLEGSWSGMFFGKLPPKLRPVKIEFSGPHAMVAWTRKGCSTNWVGSSDAGDAGTMEYTERSNMPLMCPGGALVKVDALSDDTVLMTWDMAGLAQVWGLARR